MQQNDPGLQWFSLALLSPSSLYHLFRSTGGHTGFSVPLLCASLLLQKDQFALAVCCVFFTQKKKTWHCWSLLQIFPGNKQLAKQWLRLRSVDLCNCPTDCLNVPTSCVWISRGIAEGLVGLVALIAWQHCSRWTRQSDVEMHWMPYWHTG